MPEIEFRTLTDAFGYFGTIPRNIRYAWSAKNSDGDTIVLTWWKDQVDRDGGGKLLMERRNLPSLHQWRDRRGNRERIKHLAHARDHCDGLFRVIWLKAADPNKPTRRTAQRWADETLWMRLDPDSLNEETGEFCAREVEHA
jgi:hypothetical protein